MTPGDVARVFAYCALFDNRKMPEGEEGERLIMAWYSVLGAVERDMALEACRRHYGESTDYLTPAHIMAGVRRIKAEQRRAVPHEARQLPSPFEKDATRQITMARGSATAREVLGPLLDKLAQRSASGNSQSALDQLRAITPGPDWDDETTTEKEGK